MMLFNLIGGAYPPTLGKIKLHEGKFLKATRALITDSLLDEIVARGSI